VAKVLKDRMKPIAGDLRMSYAEIDLPFAELPTREKLAEDARDKNKFVASRARLLLKQLEKDGSLRRAYPYPIQVWGVGSDLDWVTLGGEVVVDYALRLKKENGAGKTWVMGYANDVMAYIPSLRVLKEGGYEGGGAMVYYGLPTVWGPRVEELIVAGVHGQIKKLR
jgi:neutral ceramidase